LFQYQAVIAQKNQSLGIHQQPVGSLMRVCVYGHRFASKDCCKAEVMNWLAFYKATRCHAKLDHVSRMTFGENWFAQQARRYAQKHLLLSWQLEGKFIWRPAWHT
jgi:hypothetical protein